MSNLFKMVVVSLFLSLLPRAAQATAQEPDILIIEGKAYALNTNPLTGYLLRRKWAPPKEVLTTSANWRGYIAKWAVDEKQLVLVDVTILVNYENGVEGRKSILRDLFPDSSKIVADWYTGTLIIPDGELKEYVHMGYGSTYDHYQIIRISSGKVLEQLSMNDSEVGEYKARKFEAFTKTEDYKKARVDLREKSKDMTEGEIRDFIQSFYAEDYLTR